MWRQSFTVLAVLMLLPLAVLADDEGQYWGPHGGMMGGGWGGMGMGPGMMGGGSGMGMMGMGPVHMLDLTDEQRSKLNKLQDEERRKHWETMGKIMDEQSKLRDLYTEDKRNTQAILRVQDQINLHRRNMMELHLNILNQVEALLTKEQREQLKTLRRGGYGPGMMGPGAMGRGMMR